MKKARKVQENNDIEERIVENEIVADDDLEVHINQYDAGEWLVKHNDLSTNAQQINMLSGEIVRKKKLLGLLLERESALQTVLKEIENNIKERYALSPEYQWNVNFYECIARGIKKDK